MKKDHGTKKNKRSAAANAAAVGAKKPKKDSAAAPVAEPQEEVVSSGKPDYIRDVSPSIRKTMERRMRAQSLRTLKLTGNLQGIRTEELQQIHPNIQNVKWLNYSDTILAKAGSREEADAIVASLNGTAFRDSKITAIVLEDSDQPPTNTLVLSFSKPVEEAFVWPMFRNAEFINCSRSTSKVYVTFRSKEEAELGKKMFESLVRIDGCIPLASFIEKSKDSSK